MRVQKDKFKLLGRESVYLNSGFKREKNIRLRYRHKETKGRKSKVQAGLHKVEATGVKNEKVPSVASLGFTVDSAVVERRCWCVALLDLFPRVLSTVHDQPRRPHLLALHPGATLPITQNVRYGLGRNQGLSTLGIGCIDRSEEWFK